MNDNEMQQTFLLRTEMLLGKENIKRLQNARVAIFGIGGVGGYVAESLARCGIGKIDLIDKDVIDETNINRQIIALHSTVGKAKVDVMKERILDINSSAIVVVHKLYFNSETARFFDFFEYDYVIDAVDDVQAKIEIITQSKNANIQVISCMGTGNKLNPLAFRVADISKTTVCPLAKKMRNELKKRNISDVKVVFSEETPKKTDCIIGSVSYVPSVAGFVIASECIKDLTILTKS